MMILVVRVFLFPYNLHYSVVFEVLSVRKNDAKRRATLFVAWKIWMRIQEVIVR
jgi:hypothetical protein